MEGQQHGTSSAVGSDQAVGPLQMLQMCCSTEFKHRGPAADSTGSSMASSVIPAMVGVFEKRLGYKCVCLDIRADVEVAFQTLT